MSSNDEHWTKKVFLEKPLLFLPILKSRINRANKEVESLLKIFKDNQIRGEKLVLDLACGIGRHSVILAEKGFKVVGIDISPEYIELAKKLAEKKKVHDKCRFIVGDIRYLKDSIEESAKFDAVISMFTSIGYYDRKTDESILRQAKEVTVSGGILVIEVVNKEQISRFVRKTWHEIPGELLHLEAPSYNPKNSRLFSEWRVFKPIGDDLKYLGRIEFDNLIYSHDELKTLIEQCGWKYKDSYGDMELVPFTTDARRIVLVATYN
jgi:SAM-dependent methyltransferase